MVYKSLKKDIMNIFENESSITINIKKQVNNEFVVRFTTESGATKLFITDNWEDLFKD
jgi:hypothetical protein